MVETESFQSQLWPEGLHGLHRFDQGSLDQNVQSWMLGHSKGGGGTGVSENG